MAYCSIYFIPGRLLCFHFEVRLVFRFSRQSVLWLSISRLFTQNFSFRGSAEEANVGFEGKSSICRYLNFDMPARFLQQLFRVSSHLLHYAWMLHWPYRRLTKKIWNFSLDGSIYSNPNFRLTSFSNFMVCIISCAFLHDLDKKICNVCVMWTRRIQIHALTFRKFFVN